MTSAPRSSWRAQWASGARSASSLHTYGGLACPERAGVLLDLKSLRPVPLSALGASGSTSLRWAKDARLGGMLKDSVGHAGQSWHHLYMPP